MTRSQPAFSFDMKSSTLTSSISSPMIAKDDTMIKCKYITRNTQLGDGNFSVVKECINIQTKETYAMKLIYKSRIQDKLQLIKREFNLLKLLSHDIRSLETEPTGAVVDVFQGHHHILQLFDYFETTESIVLVTQLCDKDDLYEKIISNSHLDMERQVKPYTACLISALDFLHQQNVVHRDIKAENILFRIHKDEILTPNMVEPDYDITAHDLILGDFGLATKFNPETPNADNLKEYVGTTSYISPEIVKCRNTAKATATVLAEIDSYGCPVDIWALGVLIYFMGFGYTPFDCETDDETLNCISNCDYYIDEEFASDPTYKDFWNFIQCCFTVDDSKRLSAKQLKSHSFINKFFDTVKEDKGRDFVAVKPSLLHRNKSFNTLRTSSTSPVRRDSNYLYSSTNNKSTSISSLTQSLSRTSSQNSITKHKPSSKSLKRETVRRTISMTTMQLPSNNKPSIMSNSTFFLDPAPPVTSLMNGSFSETPLQLSNFNTTPRSSSRNNSSSSLFALDTNCIDKVHDNLPELPHLEGNMVTFDFGSSEDEYDDSSI